MTGESVHAEHFADVAQQRHATRLGMWLLIGSEVLFFAALFVLYAAERASDPSGFAAGIRHGDKTIGSINTFVLLTSSATLALGVVLHRGGRARLAALCTVVTAGLGALFLALKGLEYAHHLDENILPGSSAGARGPAAFWTLYYVLTAFHALHVTVGCGVLCVLAAALARNRRAHGWQNAFENAALYWHYVDVVWIFLWPLFYLTGGTA